MDTKNILVPLDFSETGKHALHAAETFAKLFDGIITPFHVYVPVTDMYGSDIFGMETMSAPVQDMDEIEKIHYDHLQELAEKHVSSKYLEEPVVAVGTPAGSIIEAAADYDMMVMSSHGRSGFSRFFLGSVSDKVLRTCHIPVLTVNEEKPLSGLNRMMLTTDFTEHSTEAFPLAAKIAQKAKAKLDLVHILSFETHDDEPDERAIAKQQKRLEELAQKELSSVSDLLETKIVVSSSTAHEAILDENLNHPHDLIVMSTVGGTRIENLMMGSTTSNVIRHGKSPVLSINPKAKSSREEE